MQPVRRANARKNGASALGWLVYLENTSTQCLVESQQRISDSGY